MPTSVPFLVRLRISPPLETKFRAATIFESLPSPFSSCSANAVVPYPFCNLVLRMAAALKAVKHNATLGLHLLN